MTEDEYIDAFPQGIRNTIRFLVVLKRIPAADAPDFAMQGWGQVWRYRHTHDPARSQIQTWANLIAWRCVLHYRELLETQLIAASTPLRLTRSEREDESRGDLLPPSMIDTPAYSMEGVDARLILRKMERQGYDKPARRLRRMYLEGRRPTSSDYVMHKDDLAKARKVCGL